MSDKEAPIKDWLSKQTSNQVLDWELAVQKFYPETSKSWTDAGEHLRSLTEDWNIFDAAKYLDWETLLSGKDINILDLGCGTGWLASFLSTYPSVKNIDALDSSRYSLSVMMPEIVRAMKGDTGKISPVLGLFYPLLVEDGHYDIIVASCSIHHSAGLFHVLRECNRALKKNGKLIILNETPLTLTVYLLKVINFFVSVVLCLVKKRFPEYSPSVSRAGIFYDPYLGDNIYTYSQWEYAIKQTGFSFRCIGTPYLPDKKKKRQIVKLSHFICEKI